MFYDSKILIYFMGKTIYLFVFLISSILASAQSDINDSLRRKIIASREDSSKINLLLELANQFETNNQDSSIYYLEKARKLATELHYENGLFKYYQQSAIVSFTKGDYDLSMQQTNSALQKARELNDSTKILNEPALVSLQQNEKFKTLLSKMK